MESCDTGSVQGDPNHNVTRVASNDGSLLSSPSFSSSVATYQRMIVREEVRGAMDDAYDQHAAMVLEARTTSTSSRKETPDTPPPLVEAEGRLDGSGGAVEEVGATENDATSRCTTEVSRGEYTSREHSVLVSEGHSNYIAVEDPIAHPTPLNALSAASNVGARTGKVPTVVVRISTPTSTPHTMDVAQHPQFLNVSPAPVRPSRLPPMDNDSEPSDEAAVRRRIEQISSELALRLSFTGGTSRSQSRNVTSSEGLGSTFEGFSTLQTRLVGATSDSAQVDTKRLRDGLIAMSTEARNEDVQTILCKRQIKLAEILDEQIVLRKKLQRTHHAVGTLADQKVSLEMIRSNHHAEMIRLRSEISAINKDINALKWQESSMHKQITDLTNSLQRFRHKRSTEEIKRLEELNTISYELSTVERNISEEADHYDTEWHRLRRELRSIQESIVAFNPQQWLAAAVATGMKKKIAETEFDGNVQKAHQYTAATLAAVGRRRTVAHIEHERSALDAFLLGD